MAIVDYSLIMNRKDVTKDLKPYILSITYEDAIEGESSSLEVELDNESRLFTNSWYPEKGNSIQLILGGLDCGEFVIDETNPKGSRSGGHTVTIRALENILTEEAAIKRTLRTKKTRAHEGKSLRQLAQAIARANSLTLEGKIPEITIKRVTQRKETDLKFLRRVSFDYGIIFSVRGNKLVYTDLYEIDKQSPAFSLDVSDLLTYDMKDKTSGIFKNAKVSYHNPDTEEKVTHTVEASSVEIVRNNDGIEYSQITSGDTLVINKKVENKQQAEAVAKASLYRANSQQQSGSIEFEGRAAAVAGNIAELTGLGVACSGHFCIMKATHTLNRQSDWVVACEVKRVAVVGKRKQQGKKVKQTALKTPNNQVEILTNRDGLNYSNIVEN